MGTTVTAGSGNVFLDLGFEPDEAENLRLRSELMLRVREIIDDRGLTQCEAAEVLGVTQPRVSDVVRGKIHRFTVESLVAMLHRVGLRVSISAAALEDNCVKGAMFLTPWVASTAGSVAIADRVATAPSETNYIASATGVLSSTFPPSLAERSPELYATAA